MTGKSESSGIDWRIVKEKVEVLNGERGNKRLAAMRQGDAEDLRVFIAQLRKGTADVQTILKEVNTSIGQINTDLSDVQQAITDAQTAITAANDAIADVNALIADVQTQIDDGLSSVGAELSGIRAEAGAITMPIQLSTSLATGATVTAADYNKLVTDISETMLALALLKQALD